MFIEALRTIQPGEELGYEYGLTWESSDDPKELANYACRCGAAACRGRRETARKSPGGFAISWRSRAFAGQQGCARGLQPALPRRAGK